MAKNKPENLPATVETAGAPAHLPAFGGPLAVFQTGLPAGFHFCTLPVQSPADVHAALLAVEMTTARLWDVRGSIVLVRDLAVLDGDEEDPETGEIKRVKRLYLWTPGGIGYQTPSRPARQSLARQCSRLAAPPCNRIPPYDPPLRVRVDACQSADRSKGDWLHLVVLTEGGDASGQK